MQAKEHVFKNNLDNKKSSETMKPVKPAFSMLEEIYCRAPQYYLSKQNNSFFSTQSLYELASTSKTMRAVLQSELHATFAELAPLAKTLLTHVIRGEEKEAKIMLDKNSELLLIQSSAEDYSGRTIIATPFQAAIGAGDEPMWKMMLPYFEVKEQALKQYQEWFPKEIKESSAAELKTKYHDLAAAIINDKDHGLSAIEAFRKEITAQKKMTQGTHFNLQHLIAAYQAYDDNFEVLGTWDNRNIFWQKVIGYVQRQMTAYDAQVHCSGVQSVLDNKTSFKRSLMFNNGGALFPLAADSGLGLGFDFAVYSSVGPRERTYWMPESVGRRGWAGLVEKLCRAKTEELAGLRESLEQGMYYQPK